MWIFIDSIEYTVVRSQPTDPSFVPSPIVERALWYFRAWKQRKKSQEQKKRTNFPKRYNNNSMMMLMLMLRSTTMKSVNDEAQAISRQSSGQAGEQQQNCGNEMEMRIKMNARKREKEKKNWNFFLIFSTESLTAETLSVFLDYFHTARMRYGLYSVCSIVAHIKFTFSKQLYIFLKTTTSIRLHTRRRRYKLQVVYKSIHSVEQRSLYASDR